jgi:hypothetical protein
MLPRLRRGGHDQRRMKRGLAVVQVALRQDADHVVGLQVNRVEIRRRAITAAPAHDLPRPGPQEVFPRHRGEGRLDPRVPDATGCHDLLRKGIGRYQAVPIAPAANSAQSCEVLLIDTRDGHIWKWWEAATVANAAGGSGITYMGKLTPGISPGEIIQRFRYGQSSGQ